MTHLVRRLARVRHHALLRLHPGELLAQRVHLLVQLPLAALQLLAVVLLGLEARLVLHQIQLTLLQLLHLLLEAPLRLRPLLVQAAAALGQDLDLA